MKDTKTNAVQHPNSTSYIEEIKEITNYVILCTTMPITFEWLHKVGLIVATVKRYGKVIMQVCKTEKNTVIKTCGEKTDEHNWLAKELNAIIVE